MVNLEEWKLTGEVMPALKMLTISDCNKLKALPDRLPSNLSDVTVRCEEVTWMPCDALPLLKYLILRGHVKVELSSFPALKTLWISEASYEKLPSDGWELLESLHTIEIENCPRLEFLPDGMGKLKALQTLSIKRCSQLTNLPDGMGQLKSLRTLTIFNCPELKHFPPLQYLTTLEDLYIRECPHVEEQLEKELREDPTSILSRRWSSGKRRYGYP